MRYENKKTLLEKQEVVNQLLESKNYRFRFPCQLEQQYKEHCRQRVRHRIPAVGISVVVFMLIFVVLDFYMLPIYLVQETIVVRIFLVVPMVVLVCSWLYFKMPKYYLIPYGFVFLLGSLSVVWIIWRAHSMGVLLPYEGLMIAMMYGFVVMGLPFFVSCFLNGLTVLAYATTEPFYYLSFPTYLNNVLFLGTMYLAGTVSAWILAYSQRGQYLQHELLNINEELAILNLQARNKYIAVASHDLRQPLKAIEMISEELVKDQHDERVEKIHLASRSLSNMFNQLLDVSRVQLDAISPEKHSLSLSEFLQGVVSPFQTTAQAKGIELHYQDKDIWVDSDFSALHRIVSNLIQNAINHSQCSDIWVNAYEWQDNVILEVKDNGIGISSSDWDRVFNEFTQINKQQDVTGLGVGLAIVKYLSEKLGHQLTFSSDNGCAFQLSIEKAVPPPKEMTQNSVLLVEDDTSLMNQYTSWFTNWGWKVFSTDNVTAAINYLKERPSLVLTDWNLNEGTGKEVLEGIDHIKNYDPRCMVITGNPDQLNDLNHDWDVYEKPMSASRLRACIET